MRLCAAAVLVVIAWAAPVASAARTTQRDPRGDVRGGARLAEPARAALDIVKVTARRDAAGLAVDVRLRGDFERVRIAFSFDQVGPGAGSQNVVLDWSASWK